jgi:hypothetical protein
MRKVDKITGSSWSNLTILALSLSITEINCHEKNYVGHRLVVFAGCCISSTSISPKSKL